MSTVEGNEDEHMDIDHYNDYEDDDIAVSHNHSVVACPTDESSSRQPLSKD